MIILGLDMSSTCIGYSVLDNGIHVAGGYEELTGNIAAKCSQAARYVGGLYTKHLPELVIIESPVARFAKSLISQARVSGAVLARLNACQALWQEIEPAVAKKALTGKGNADKREMLTAAGTRLNLPGHVEAKGGKVHLVRADGYVLLSEDEADAYGLALAGLAVKVITKGAA